MYSIYLLSASIVLGTRDSKIFSLVQNIDTQIRITTEYEKWHERACLKYHGEHQLWSLGCKAWGDFLKGMKSKWNFGQVLQMMESVSVKRNKGCLLYTSDAADDPRVV